jgi:hypothetical protein
MENDFAKRKKRYERSKLIMAVCFFGAFVEFFRGALFEHSHSGKSASVIVVLALIAVGIYGSMLWLRTTPSYHDRFWHYLHDNKD